MQSISHKITHQFQPTNTTCGYTSLSMLMSHYDRDIAVDKLLADVPQGLGSDGEPIGSVSAQLAAWCIGQGFEVEFWSFDFLITDFGWQGLSQDELVQKLEAVKDIRDVSQAGGKEWSRIYVQAYIDFIKAGGTLRVEPHVTTKLLYEKIQTAPIFVNVCPSVMNGTGRMNHSSPRTPDDIHGTVGTHSVIMYGVAENGDFLIADPWDGLVVKSPETMLCAITAANLECDSQIFQLRVVESE